MPDRMPDSEPAYTYALYRTVKHAVHLLNAILDVPVNDPLPFVLRERAATMIEVIQSFKHRPNPNEGKRDARSHA